MVVHSAEGFQLSSTDTTGIESVGVESGEAKQGVAPTAPSVVLSDPEAAIAVHSAAGDGGPAPPTAAARAGYFRWTICALLFFATTINYLDRQIIAILKPTLQGELGWSEIDYSNIIFAFQLAYAVGLLVAGRVMDRLGSRKGFSVAVVVWSAAAMVHAGV